MIEIIYKSTASPDLPAGEVYKIIEVSALNNSDLSLTGFLIFAGGQFFQLIEGPSQSIDALMERISADSRHQNIECLSSASIAKRGFTSWRMKRIAANPKAHKNALRELEAADAAPHVTGAVRDFLASL